MTPREWKKPKPSAVELNDILIDPADLPTLQAEFERLLTAVAAGLPVPQSLAFTAWLSSFARDLAGYGAAGVVPEPSRN